MSNSSEYYLLTPRLFSAVGSNDWIAMHQAMMAQMGANPALAPAANPFFNPFAACGVNQALAGAMPQQQQQQQKSKKSKDNSGKSFFLAK